MSDLKVVKPTDGEMYLRWCKGNEHAARFIGSLGLISQIADDFVDEDNPKVTGRLLDRSKAMGVLLASIFADLLPNPFFQQNEGILLPLMVNSVAYWEASNDWTISHKRETRMFGFVHREALERVVAMVAMIVGGWDHQRAVVREMHQFYHGIGAVETFDEWDATTAEVKRA